MKIGMVSLGCDKNRVDTEKILYRIIEAGHKLTDNPSEADVILINTCSFIDAAKKESINTILDFVEQKKINPQKKIIALGCLVERYSGDLQELIPEIDAMVGINSYEEIVNIIETCEPKILKSSTPQKIEPIGRVLTTFPHTAYLKIADGCDNFCSYCAIPFIRGRYRSYPMDTLVEEATELFDSGVKELILVAQDTTRYGYDLYGECSLIKLLKKLSKIDFWKIRILYAYPELINDELIQYIVNNKKIAKYLDIPLQHISSSVLKRMNRRCTQTSIEELLSLIHKYCDKIVLRSSFIVGFPGETEEEYYLLKDFISNGNIDFAGFFKYSKEEGSKANKMSNQIKASVKNVRIKELSSIQSQIIIEKQQQYVGQVLEVLYEGIDDERLAFWGRTEFQSPNIDTKVFFTADVSLEVGEVYKVLITSADFNLYGKLV